MADTLKIQGRKKDGYRVTIVLPDGAGEAPGARAPIELNATITRSARAYVCQHHHVCADEAERAKMSKEEGCVWKVAGSR